METWAIIFNPTAGTFRPRRLEAVQRALHSHGVRARLLATEAPGHATELARAVEGVTRVAAFGGDGTLNEVANGLLGRPEPLVFLPCGTANVMAWELGLPTDPERAAVAGLRAKPHAVRPGMVDGRAFLLMAGFGFDGAAVYGVNPRLKAWSGKSAYLWSGLRALATPAPTLRVHGLGESSAGDSAAGDSGTDAPGGASDAESPPLEGAWLVMARAKHYGGPFQVHPQAGLLSPHLGLALVRRGWVLPFLAGHLGLRLHRERRGVALRRVESVRLECDRLVHVQIDGDYLTRGTDFRIGLAAEAVQLCFPWQ